MCYYMFVVSNTCTYIISARHRSSRENLTVSDESNRFAFFCEDSHIDPKQIESKK
jgi:hypothetical protein